MYKKVETQMCPVPGKRPVPHPGPCPCPPCPPCPPGPQPIRPVSGVIKIVDHVGIQGPQGCDGITPSINPLTHTWMLGTYDTGISAEGTPGDTPYIGSNKHWYISGVDTGVVAEGKTPTILIDPETHHWIINRSRYWNCCRRSPLCRKIY